MKKIISILLSAIITFSSLLFLSSCTDKNVQNKDSSDRLSIVTSIFPYYDFVREIAGDKADIRLLLQPGNEPHTYEPSPSDIVAIENCDIFIYNGGESDQWVEDILETSENKKLKHLRMMDYVNTFCADEYKTEHHHSEEEHNQSEEHHHEVDEHIWTSVRNAITLSNVIADTLAEVDASFADYYRENVEKYIYKLKEIDEEISLTVEKSTHNMLIFGDRFPFLYFASDYNLDYESAFPGCSSETEPSILTVTHLIDYVRENKISVVFYLEFSNGKIAKLISEDTDAKTMRFSSCHNVTKDEFEKGCSYISLMTENVKALKEALS
jgi:zinc transport system substrate-binding protein